MSKSAKAMMETAITWPFVLGRTLTDSVTDDSLPSSIAHSYIAAVHDLRDTAERITAARSHHLNEIDAILGAIRSARR